MKQLILGGARSGKSAIAEKLAIGTSKSLIYIATAQVGDTEMKQRIELHQERRSAKWETVEEAIELTTAIKQYNNEKYCIVVDCLTLWLTNLLLLNNEEIFSKQLNDFVDSIDELQADLIIVSNETSMGIVPLGELSRRYIDEAGLMHQRISKKSDRVIMTIAGLPMFLKGEPYAI